jgi:MFS family permease
MQGLLLVPRPLRSGPEALGALFFNTSLLSALSFLVATRVAERVGLLNTMVFTHLPSNVLLLVVPFMPSFGTAAAVLLARHVLSQMDVPTRQSYTMAVVEPEERPAAAGLTASARALAQACAPIVSGLTMAAAATPAPFLLAGGSRSSTTSASSSGSARCLSQGHVARILRGDIRWADLNPVRGHEQAGMRPVLVLSHDVFNERSGTVIAMAMTSQEPRAGFPHGRARRQG